ncbi:MAG: hypothetical protein LUQ04_07180 [Methanoregula sp.]|nr:hypothetical protein [Methanoregula sp.]
MITRIDPERVRFLNNATLRPLGECPVFGMVRYMNAQGLTRKFDMNRYI